jgi:hypothetical protein
MVTKPQRHRECTNETCVLSLVFFKVILCASASLWLILLLAT